MIQVMACHRFGANTLSEPVLKHCQLHTCEQNSVTLSSKFFFDKNAFQMSAKWQSFCLALNMFKSNWQPSCISWTDNPVSFPLVMYPKMPRLFRLALLTYWDRLILLKHISSRPRNWSKPKHRCISRCIPFSYLHDFHTVILLWI